MKLDNISEAVQTSGGSEANSFNIACNGKAFRVLSDTLYQNKIGSIVRELSCNAYDAHVAAKNTATPFVIHLPDNFEPWFSVQDYGTGLSPDAIKSVFTVYFQSSKDQSNDAIGAFGLGAKTPFSYTDQFTVTSVYAGKKAIYGMYITASGVPDYKLMMEEDSTEPNGVEIKMSVKANDYRTFATEVQQQLQYFTIKPTILNGSVQWAVKTYAVETTNARLDVSTYSSRGPVIVQGMVGYPMNMLLLIQKITEPVAQQMLKDYLYSGLELLFNIGEIGVTASREAVEYTETTLKNIEVKLLQVNQEIQAWASQELASCKTDWERVHKINDSALLSKLTTNMKIDNARRVGTWFAFGLPCMFELDAATNKNKAIGMLYSKSTNRVKLTNFSMTNISIDPSNTKVIVLKDKPTLMTAKIDYLQSQYQGATILVIERYDKQYTSAFIKKLKENLGGFDNIIKLSEVQLPANVTTSVAVRSKIPKYYEQVAYSSEIRDWSKEFDSPEEITDDVIYVEVESLDLVHHADYSNLQIYNNLKQLETVPKLIGLRKTGIEKIKNKSNFIALGDWINRTREEVKQTPELQKAIDKVHISKFVRDYIDLPYRATSAVQYLKATKTDIGKFVLASERYNYDLLDSQTKYLANRGTILGLTRSEQANSKLDRMASISKRLHKKYKFLELYYDIIRKFGPEALAEYVEIVYNHHKSTK